MPDINRFLGTDLSKVDYVVSPSSAQSGLVTLLGAVAATISGTVTIFGMLSKGSINEAAAYVQSAGGLAYITAIITLASIGGLAYRSFFKHEEKKEIADASPNAIVATKAEAKALGLK